MAEYGFVTWVLTKYNNVMIEVLETKMLRWIFDRTKVKEGIWRRRTNLELKELQDIVT